MPPVSQVTNIRTLQEFDDEAATYRAALEDIEHRLRGSEELEQARASFAALDTELAEVRRTQRKVDGDISILNARIAPEEKRLYDGSVRNPKELGNIQHELELLKDQRSKLEDQLSTSWADWRPWKRTTLQLLTLSRLRGPLADRAEELQDEARRLPKPSPAPMPGARPRS